MGPRRKVVSRSPLAQWLGEREVTHRIESLECGHTYLLLWNEPQQLTRYRFCNACAPDWKLRAAPPGPPPQNSKRPKVTLEDRVRELEAQVKKLLEERE